MLSSQSPIVCSSRSISITSLNHEVLYYMVERHPLEVTPLTENKKDLLNLTLIILQSNPKVPFKEEALVPAYNIASDSTTWRECNK